LKIAEKKTRYGNPEETTRCSPFVRQNRTEISNKTNLTMDVKKCEINNEIKDRKT